MLQLLVRMILPMCTSSPLTLVYILRDAIVFLLLRRHLALSPFVVSARHLPGFELLPSFLAPSSCIGHIGNQT